MRSCPWCGRENLNVYAYCQSCGRGWSGPQGDGAPAPKPKPRDLSPWRKFWPFGRRAA